jgi:hypothetical protein
MVDRSMAPDKQRTLPCAAPRGDAAVGAPGERPPVDDERRLEHGVERANLVAALARVKAHAGSPGVEGRTGESFPGSLQQHWPAIRLSCLPGTSQPSPVQRVALPKPGGGMRKLGLPTVRERFLPQALLHTLQPQWDPTFAEGRDRGAPGALGASGAGPCPAVGGSRRRLGGGPGAGKMLCPREARQGDAPGPGTGAGSTRVATERSVPHSGRPHGRRLCGDRGRDTPRGAAVAPGRQSPAGSLRPSAGTSRAPMRARRGRAHSLWEKRPSWPAGPGEGAAVSCPATAAHGQGGHACGRPPLAPDVLGLSAHQAPALPPPRA